MFQVAKMQVRYLNLLEYQSKALLESSGVAIQKFRVVENIQEAKCLTQDFSKYMYIILLMYYSLLRSGVQYIILHTCI